LVVYTERSISKSKEYEKQNIKEPVGNFRIRKKIRKWPRPPHQATKIHPNSSIISLLMPQKAIGNTIS